MMNNYYSLETYNKNRKYLRVWLVLLIIIFFVSLALVGLSAFLVKPSSAVAIIVVDSIILSISLCVVIFLIFEKYIPYYRRNKFLYNLLIVNRYEGTIKIKKINKPYLVKKNIEAYEIEAIDDTNKIFVCYLETSFPLSFKEGDEISVLLANSFIVDILESNNEKDN